MNIKKKLDAGFKINKPIYLATSSFPNLKSIKSPINEGKSKTHSEKYVITTTTAMTPIILRIDFVFKLAFHPKILRTVFLLFIRDSS